MGIWSFIQPTATTNYVQNPSFERNITDGWINYASGAAGGARTWQLGAGKFGAHSLYLTKNAGAVADRYGMSDVIATSALNQVYIASAWVYTPNAATAYLLMAKAAGVGAYQEVSTTQVGASNAWVRLETPVLTANATGDVISIFIFIIGTPTINAYFDAVQVELRNATTTYCDGDQPGCEWLGAAHNSISSRSAVSRAGGTLVDFADRDFAIEGMIGSGMSPITLNVDSYAILPGGELNSQKTNVRPFALTGWVRGTSLSDLHAKRQQIIEDVAPNSVPGNQPVTLRYTGASVTKEISAYYEAGLEGRIRADFPCLEQNFALRFVAADPDFYEVGESAIILDPANIIGISELVLARLRTIGNWDDLGPPNAAGTYNAVYDVEVASDGLVYWGGDFLNFDNVAAADYLTVYNQVTGTWAAVGGGLGAGANIVYDVLEGPDGSIYVCGTFLNAGGVANADYIAYWDGAAWNAVGNPNAGGAVITDIRRMAFDSEGNLYIVGTFTNLAGIAAADYVAMWDGAAWNAVGAPAAGAAVIAFVYAVAIDSQDNIYVGGSFTSFANVAGADYIAVWDGAAWSAMVQLNSFVYDIAIDNRDNVFFAGLFTNAGGDANGDYIAMWNGQSTSALSTGFNNQCFTIRIAPNGDLYAAGSFTIAGGIPVFRQARWNGSSWVHVDTDTIGPRVFAFGRADPVVAENFDIWVGRTATGAVDHSGIVTPTNAGTESAYPRFEIYRTGGTSATLFTIRNETTGKELLFDYALLDGERLYIDLDPTQKRIWSSFWGQRQEALLPNSDFGEWSLQPGANRITCFVDLVGAPGIEIAMIWRDPYWSAD